jgi:hypothetical protein
MKTIKFKQLLFVLFVCCFSIVHAQVNDAGLWLTVSAEKKLNNRFKLGMAQEVRWRENYSMIGTIFTDVSIGYKVSKGLNVSANYRLAFRQSLDLEFNNRHRFYFDLSYRQKFNKLILSARSRIQNQSDFQRNNGEFDRSVLYWRNKLTAKWNLKKIAPYAAFEVYYTLNNAEKNIVDGLRMAVGVDYNLSKKSTLTPYFLVDKEVQVANPLTSYIVGIEYNYSF